MSAPAQNERTGPLADVRVIEICSTIAGPACTRLLADFGAEVIKIEPPEGDPVRQMGQHVDEVSLYAASLLRNKRSVVLDLKTPEGREVAFELMARADIVVENNRPGVMDKLGIEQVGETSRHEAEIARHVHPWPLLADQIEPVAGDERVEALVEQADAEDVAADHLDMTEHGLQMLAGAHGVAKAALERLAIDDGHRACAAEGGHRDVGRLVGQRHAADHGHGGLRGVRQADGRVRGFQREGEAGTIAGADRCTRLPFGSRRCHGTNGGGSNQP